jgi:YegS/Rv2252/BmrU family lipid kinase
MPGPIRFIFNPNANLGRARRQGAALHALADQLGGGDWCETRGPGHATELARDAALTGFARVVAMGGDGTVHVALNGLMQAPAGRRPALGVVPTGSGNDFSFASGLPADPQAALRRAITGERAQVDIGAVEDDGRRKYWCNAIGIGFDTIVTIHTRSMKPLKGFALFLMAVLKTIAVNHETFTIRARMDGQEWSGSLHLLVLANGRREGGGFMVAPTSISDDGWLDFTGVEQISRARMLATLPHIINGTQAQLKYVRQGRFRSMEIESDIPLKIHTDGEIWSGFDSATRHLAVQILPGVVEIVR